MSDFAEVAQAFIKRNERYEENLRKAADAILKELQETRIPIYEGLFQDAVSEFYGAYTNTVYSRNNSIKNIATLTNKGNYIEVKLSDDNLTPMRNGGSLYDQVIRNGWHGGALAPDGVMRYRTGYHWNRWGEAAVQTEPVLSIVQRNINEWDSTELEPLARSIADKHLSNISY